MTNAEILAHIDHTVLKPDAKWEDIAQICREALTYHTASVCIPPFYVARAKREFPELNVCTVIGFPLGYQQTAVKVCETSEAVNAGAQPEDIALFRRYIGPDVKMKAAGGIRTREQMEAFLAAGCDRIGCSAAKILFDET